LCRMPAAQWFIAEVADALLTMTIEDNGVKVGAVTVEDAVSAASEMLGAFQPMIGLIFPTVAATLPDNFLLCDGSTHLRVDYPALYAMLATPFIVDADNFLVPDMRGRVPVGIDPTGTPSFVVGQQGGEFEHVLSIAESASHTHIDSGHIHVEGTTIPSSVLVGVGAPVPTAVGFSGVTGSASANLDTVGSDTAHNNTQPYTAVRYAIVSE